MIDCKSSSNWFYPVRHCLVKTEVNSSGMGIQIKCHQMPIKALWLLWFLDRIKPATVLLVGKIWGT